MISISISENAPLITDWIMVVITAIYVIATVAICFFNGNSASAAKKQTKEMISEQKQNVNIQLYEKRMGVLKAFQKKDYNNCCLESSILFNKEFGDRISSIWKKSILKNELSSDIENAENSWGIFEEKYIFEEYISLKQKWIESDYYRIDESELIDYCKEHYHGDRREVPNLPTLLKQYGELSLKIKNEHSEIFADMYAFLKDTILPEE